MSCDHASYFRDTHTACGESVNVCVYVCEIKHLVPPMAESTGRDTSHDASSEGLYSPPTPSSGMRLRKELKGRTMPASRCGGSQSLNCGCSVIYLRILPALFQQ